MRARSCARCRRTFTGGVFTGPLGEQCPVCLAFLERQTRELGADWKPAGGCPWCGAQLFAHVWRGVAHTGDRGCCAPFAAAVTAQPSVAAQLYRIDLERN